MSFQVENLAGRRGMRMVFRDIGFVLAPGEALFVTGPNGSGKSSLLRVLAGLLPALRGEMRWMGAAARDAEHRARLHYIGHHDAVKPELTVAEMVEYWGALRGGAKQETPSPAKTKDLLKQVQVFASSPSRGEEHHSFLDTFSLTAMWDMPIRYLSAGQKRRLALVRLAMSDAPLWLLDEPATSLDRAGQELLSDLIRAHRAKGGIAIIAAHHEMELPDAKHLSLGGGA